MGGEVSDKGCVDSAVSIPHLGENCLISRTPFGNGGFAEVYIAVNPEAMDSGVNRAISALKVPNLEKPGAIDDFRAEVEALIQIHLAEKVPGHLPHVICQLFDDENPKRTVTLASGEEPREALQMKLYPLGKLNDLKPELNVSSLHPIEYLYLLRDMLDAARATHSAGFVDRDFARKNLMVVWLPERSVFDCDGNIIGTLAGAIGCVKIDFGGAERQDKNLGPDEDGKIFGSTAYMDPAVINKEEFNTKSDLYAIGCTIWELIRDCSPVSDLIEEPVSENDSTNERNKKWILAHKNSRKGISIDDYHDRFIKLRNRLFKAKKYRNRIGISEVRYELVEEILSEFLTIIAQVLFYYDRANRARSADWAIRQIDQVFNLIADIFPRGIEQYHQILGRQGELKATTDLAKRMNQFEKAQIERLKKVYNLRCLQVLEQSDSRSTPPPIPGAREANQDVLELNSDDFEIEPDIDDGNSNIEMCHVVGDVNQDSENLTGEIVAI